MSGSVHRDLCEQLGIPADYGHARNLPVYSEAAELVDVGPNLVGRMQRLSPEAAARIGIIISTTTAPPRSRTRWMRWSAEPSEKRMRAR